MQINEIKLRLNNHTTHMESLVTLGQEGLEEINDKIDKFLTNLGGGLHQLNTTTKIDGSPAVVCWSKFEDYPDNSICLKSFLTSNNNCLSSVDDIEAKYGERPDMAEKLMYCLLLAKSIPSGEAWQGDCLYTKSDLREVEIGGTNYLTFQPNKIVYAFTDNDEGYENVVNSDFGICFHTIYKGNLENKTQSFNVDASRLSNVPEGIYVMSPALGENKREDFNEAEILNKYEALKQAEDNLLKDNAYELLCDNKVFKQYWDMFENANLSDKQATTINIDTFFDDLVEFVNTKKKNEYDKKVAGLKTEKGIENATNKYNEEINEINSLLSINKYVIINLVKTLNLVAEIKMLMWEGYKKAKQNYATFYNTKSRGYIPADMEGVAMSDQDGNIVKIVDRSTFSHANRSDDYLSGWQREDLEESIGSADIVIRAYVEPSIDEALPSGDIDDIYDEQTLEDWYDFAATIEGIIDRHGDVVNIQLSKHDNSLSEYIDFYTIGSDGEKQPGFIDLRLSDHKQTNNARRVRTHKVRKFDTNYQLKTVIVNDKRFDSYDDAIQHIRNMFNMRIEEDTIKKKNGKWVNKGEDGEHGEFKTKKEADAQRKAIFASGWHEGLDQFYSNKDKPKIVIRAYVGKSVDEQTEQEWEDFIFDVEDLLESNNCLILSTYDNSLSHCIDCKCENKPYLIDMQLLVNKKDPHVQINSKRFRSYRDALPHIKDMIAEEQLFEGNSLGRLFTHLNDDTTFAIIGSLDKDDLTKSHWEELKNLSINNDKFMRNAEKAGRRVSWKYLKGRYTMNDTGETIVENSIILYNITREMADYLAYAINQESYIWEDDDFFGFVYTDGHEENIFSRSKLGLNPENLLQFASKLASKHAEGQDFAFTLNEVMSKPGRHWAIRPGDIWEEELLRYYSDEDRLAFYECYGE